VTDDRAWIQNFITNDCKIYCGFDADETGDTMANKMIKRYPSIKRLRPSKHDWNGVLQSNSLYAAQTQPSPLYFGPHGSFHLFDKNIWQEDWKRYQQQ
jgi:hypothetical protein